MKGGLSSSVDLVLSHLRLNGVSAAQDMASRLKVSQPTLTRALNQCQPQVLKIGRARSTRYALRRDVPPLGNNWPIFSVGSDGIAENQGVLTALHRGQWHVEASASLAHLIRGDFHGGIFSGLPWFLADLRPQGFLGRAFARTHAAGLGGRFGSEPMDG